MLQNHPRKRPLLLSRELLLLQPLHRIYLALALNVVYQGGLVARVIWSMVAVVGHLMLYPHHDIAASAKPKRGVNYIWIVCKRHISVKF